MKHQISWNLKLLYKNERDPRIERDMRDIENACKAFEKKYRGKPFTKSPEALSKALRDYEKLSIKIREQKPWWYFILRTHLDSSDDLSDARATKYDQRSTEASSKIKFFMLDVAKVPQKNHKAFLKHKSLKKYSYFLSHIFDKAKFNLSEGEEQLDDLLSQTSYTMWVEGHERLLSQQTIKHKGKLVPITEALSKLSNFPKKERHIVADQLNKTFKSISHSAENELNAVYNYKKVMDERRGYKNPYSATILKNENDEKAIENFVALVSKYFKISRRFYKLHARLLGEKKLAYADRSVKIGEIKTKFDFKTSVDILRGTLGRIDKDYLAFFDRFLENGQLDVYPKKGKHGGAYCWGMGQLPIFVLLNHSNDIRSLETLAHEMGHAIHGELGRQQPPLYRGHSTSTAEVASTFFEQTVSEEIEKRLSPKEKIVLLHNKILGDMSTIFRQIACFNFEHELHREIRRKGKVSKDEMADLMSKHMRAYMGDAVEVTRDDGYFFVNWLHIRNFFYVYTYAYGQLISRAMYEKWKENPSYAEKIKQFLSAGKSTSPENIFKMIGIDTSRPAFFEAGLKAIDRDITKLEKLTK